MNRSAALAAIGLVGLTTAPAHAFQCLVGSCPKWCDTVPYGITVTSADLGEETTISEVRRGMDDWTTRSCTSLMTNYTGPSTARAGAQDQRSVIGWVESGWPSAERFAIGVTRPVWDFRNCIREADMEMNGTHFSWTTGSGQFSNVNAYSIVLHEGGHYYGLGHSSSGRAVMFASYGGGIQSITNDDEAGICTLYPGSGGGTVDCTTAGCPAGQECVNRSCRPRQGDGTMCAPCSGNTECGGSSDACLRYPDGVGYCARACNGPGDCDDGDVCALISGIAQCLRVVGNQPDCSGGATPSGCVTDSDCAPQICDSGSCVDPPTGGLELGEPCAGHQQCNSLRCSVTPDGAICTQSCNGFDTGSCPDGFFCDGEAAGSCGTGLCLEGTAGAMPLGAACSADTDCATLMCDGGTCAVPCQPDGATTCPDGTTCQPGATPGCGACREDGSLGVPGAHCDANEDCQSGQCAVRDNDDQFCTSQCMDDSMCPMNFTCLPIGSISICIPPAGFVPETTTPRRDDGCGCRVPGSASIPPGVPLHWGLMLLLVGRLVRRRWRR